MGEHHAFGFARRTRRELDERRLVRAQACRCAGSRNVVERIDQERSRLERAPGFGLAEGGGIRREAVAKLLVGVEERLPELLRDAQQLVLVLVADADGDRHRHDAAVEAGPVRVDELLVARHVQDQVVARLRADTLQVEQDAERAPPQVRELERLLGTFALEVNDRAVAARAVVEHVRKRLVLDHRCSYSHVNVTGRPQVDARLEGRLHGLRIGQLKPAHRIIEVQEDLVEREVLPDAVARPGRKRNVRECMACFDLRGVEMARIERLRQTPVSRMPMHEVGADEDVCAGRYRVPTQRVRSDAAAGQQPAWRIQPHRLVHDLPRVRQADQVGIARVTQVAHGALFCGNAHGNGGVGGQQPPRPVERARRRFVTGDDERHDLVDDFSVAHGLARVCVPGVEQQLQQVEPPLLPCAPNRDQRLHVARQLAEFVGKARVTARVLQDGDERIVVEVGHELPQVVTEERTQDDAQRQPAGRQRNVHAAGTASSSAPFAHRATRSPRARSTRSARRRGGEKQAASCGAAGARTRLRWS